MREQFFTEILNKKQQFSQNAAEADVNNLIKKLSIRYDVITKLDELEKTIQQYLFNTHPQRYLMIKPSNSFQFLTHIILLYVQDMKYLCNRVNINEEKILKGGFTSAFHRSDRNVEIEHIYCELFNCFESFQLAIYIQFIENIEQKILFQKILNSLNLKILLINSNVFYIQMTLNETINLYENLI